MSRAAKDDFTDALIKLENVGGRKFIEADYNKLESIVTRLFKSNDTNESSQAFVGCCQCTL